MLAGHDIYMPLAAILKQVKYHYCDGRQTRDTIQVV